VRVLDLGCGSGRELASWGVTASDKVTGLNIDGGRLAVAKLRFSNRTYVQGSGEHLPFGVGCFDCVISAVALPAHEHRENSFRNSPHSCPWRALCC
jgi:ubiquinone/menaquinone biosynthesis C-methylase UbiE